VKKANTTEALLRARAALPSGHPDRERLRRQAIITSLPLARQLARRYAGRGEPLDDLVQVASLALVRAVADYDPARNDSFAGYAVPTILGRLKNHFRDHTWDIRVPRRLREAAAGREAATAELAQRLRRFPTTPELAGHLHVDRDTLTEAAYVAQLHRLASLDAADPRDGLSVEDPGYARVDTRLTMRPLLAALPP
jgi:RNA polymerase sigma-B factor